MTLPRRHSPQTYIICRHLIADGGVAELDAIKVAYSLTNSQRELMLVEL